MAYDSKTFGQSPFGAAKPDASESDAGKLDAAKTPLADDGLDKGSAVFDNEAAQATGKVADASTTPKLKDRFPNLSSITGQLPGAKTNRKTDEKPSSSTPKTPATKTRSRASKSAPKSTSRKSKKSKSAKPEIEAAEAEVARRFQAENRNAYLSLVYKTGISGLIWAVLRLLHYELPKDVFAIINIIIHPLVIATVALLAAVGLTFWLRYLLNDLAIHTQQLHADAETPEGKNYRPTLEIVGDSLEYNPQLRKNFAALFNVASILICSLASYLMIFAAFPE
ncbi:MAG: hypothetical protein DCF25_21950 [Leptolyngbya foveolarum]|uniref:Uncharacterized protein n=1 Tax=Leptolyngbya foveolarum TaxID=47253 RepID=A0A2W4VPD7_9CYAN|nr:MAG: hypothetical protein DCF25_21950 [Leptolyngbya foveolarum]